MFIAHPPQRTRELSLVIKDDYVLWRSDSNLSGLKQSQLQENIIKIHDGLISSIYWKGLYCKTR